MHSSLCLKERTHVFAISRDGPLSRTTRVFILISCSHQRPVADLYGFSIQEAIPSFPLPLKKSEQEVTVELQAIFNGIYERGRYQTRIDYCQPPPPPPLSESDTRWLENLLAPLRG